MTRILSFPSIVAMALAAFLAAVPLGCSRYDEIQRHTVSQPTSNHRMLAAIVPSGDRAWFFKVTGPNGEVAKEADSFRSFIKSVRFREDPNHQQELEWTLPENWRQLPGGDMRLATIHINATDPPLELTVTQLPARSGADTDYLVSNINRWREQLRLRPINNGELPAKCERLQLDRAKGAIATLVNMAGNLAPESTSSAPFASGGLADVGAGGAAAEPSGEERELACQAPDHWRPGQLVASGGGISIRRKAAYELAEGGRSVEITVTTLPAAAGELLPNVNRWRGQVQLPPTTQADLDRDLKKIELAGRSADYVELIGPHQAILAVVAIHDGLAWFVKLQGDHELAAREKGHFEAFVRSIQLSK